MYNWNIEKLYKEKVQSVGNVPASRHLVREYRSKAAIKKAIIDSNPLFKSGTDKGGAIRISPAVKLEDREQLKREFINTLNNLEFNVIGIIEPGPGSPSGKFDTYVVQAPGGDKFNITLAGGSFSNKGMQFERDVLTQIQTYFTNPTEVEKPKFLQEIEDILNVEFDGYDKGASFERNVKRPLIPSGPRDMGREISDITLLDKQGNPYFISLKDVGGITIGNSGAAGLFSKQGNNVAFAGQDKNRSGTALFNAARIDIERAVDGLQDYINNTQTESSISEEIADPDRDALKKLIESAFDYGYYYVKRKNAKGDLEVEDLTDKEKLDNFIGEIESVRVDYPYFYRTNKKRKHIGVNIVTTKGSFTFQVRNASGGILPDQINLVRNPSSKQIIQQQKIIQNADVEDTGVKELLGYD